MTAKTNCLLLKFFKTNNPSYSWRKPNWRTKTSRWGETSEKNIYIMYNNLLTNQSNLSYDYLQHIISSNRNEEKYGSTLLLLVRIEILFHRHEWRLRFFYFVGRRCVDDRSFHVIFGLDEPHSYTPSARWIFFCEILQIPFVRRRHKRWFHVPILERRYLGWSNIPCYVRILESSYTPSTHRLWRDRNPDPACPRCEKCRDKLVHSIATEEGGKRRCRSDDGSIIGSQDTFVIVKGRFSPW